MGAKNERQRKPVRRSKNLSYDPCAPFDLMEPPEDWQFENPIAGGTITGRKNTEVPKLNISAFVPSEEVNNVHKTMTSEQITEKVVELLNEGKSISQTAQELGYKGAGSIQRRIEKAKEQGLIGNPAVSKVSAPKVVKIDLEKFEAEAERLKTQAERLLLAKDIAVELEWLLPDNSEDLIATLFERVI